MVASKIKNKTYSRRGLRDWLMVRTTALIITACFFMFLFFWVTHPQAVFPEWHHFFTRAAVRVLTFLTVVSIILHGWIGIWVVLTDYIKPIFLRLFLQLTTLSYLIGCGIWAARLVWGA